MTRSQLTRRAPLVLAVVGLFLIVMLASAVQGSPTIHPIGGAVDERSTDSRPMSAPPGMATLPPIPPHNASNDLLGRILLFVLIALASAGVIALVVLVVRAILAAWRDRPLGRREGGDVGAALSELPTPAEPEIVVAAIQRGIAGALQQLDARTGASDAIIAAWIGLEESAADAGMTRAPSETPTEFTLRIITTRSGIAADAETLLRLYESVRFGGHAALEGDRARARHALQGIEAGWR